MNLINDKPLTPRHFQSLLLRWFDQHGRKHLPWQQNKTPYRVWISEIMLQQTQVNTVIPYYANFMQQFPDIQSLARAKEDKVMHAWAGLGYYSRARNLHAAAKKVVSEWAGIFPENIEDLIQLPGIGPSTAGAIRSIAFNQRATILDGNVKRVLARIEGIPGAINEKSVENKLWEYAERYTPVKRAADYTQAIMDLGATLCTRSKPDCAHCPFMRHCMANQHGLQDALPGKKTSRALPTREETFLVLCDDSRVFLQKRPAKGIWGGLWCFPVITGKPGKTAISRYCKTNYQMRALEVVPLDSFRHTFSHYHLTIHPVMIRLKQSSSTTCKKTQIWYNLGSPESIGLPKPVQQIVRDLA